MSDKKKDFLKKEGILNPNPERVLCPKFKSVDFFDPLGPSPSPLRDAAFRQDRQRVRRGSLPPVRVSPGSTSIGSNGPSRNEDTFRCRRVEKRATPRRGPEPGNRELYRPPQNGGTRSVRREASGGDLPAVQGGVLPPNGRENRGAARTRKKRGPRVSALTIGDAACAHPRFAEEADKAQSLYEKARKAALDGRFRVPENLSGTLKSHGVAGIFIDPERVVPSMSDDGARQGARTGTALYRTRLADGVFAAVAKSLAEGVGVSSTARIQNVDKKTVLLVLSRASEHIAKVNEACLRDLVVSECQLDEMWSCIGKKEKNLDAIEKMKSSLGDAWIWVAFGRGQQGVPGRARRQAHHAMRSRDNRGGSESDFGHALAFFLRPVGALS